MDELAVEKIAKQVWGQYGEGLVRKILQAAISDPDIPICEYEKDAKPPEYAGDGSVSHNFTIALVKEVQEDMLKAGWVKKK